MNGVHIWKEQKSSGLMPLNKVWTPTFINGGSQQNKKQGRVNKQTRGQWRELNALHME